MDAAILSVQALLVALVLYTLTRVHALEKAVTDLRVEMADLRVEMADLRVEMADVKARVEVLSIELRAAVQRLDDHVKHG
jgi:predicted  nucleic acid-binding Zn-ribbon protein